MADDDSLSVSAGLCGASKHSMNTRIYCCTTCPSFQEWTACLGHASIAAAVGAAEKGFSAWKALAEEALARARREALRGSGKGGGGHEGGADGGGLDACETAARDLAECCEASENHVRRNVNGCVSSRVSLEPPRQQGLSATYRFNSFGEAAVATGCCW